MKKVLIIKICIILFAVLFLTACTGRSGYYPETDGYVLSDDVSNAENREYL